MSLSQLWALGFGNVSNETLIRSFDQIGYSGLIGTVLKANLPQLILTFIYFIYNGIVTCMMLTKEWSTYASKPKSLRVSSPKGVQRGTYWLQIPYRYGIPLLVCSGLLHWLASQTVFLVRIDVLTSDELVSPTIRWAAINDSISTCGYSPMALILLTGLIMITIVCIVGMGFRKHKTAVPLLGNCSVVISTACHPPQGSIDTTLKCVKWEMTEERNGNPDRPRLRRFFFT